MDTQPVVVSEEEFQAKAIRTRNILVGAHALQHILTAALPTLLIFIRPDLDFTYTQIGIVAAAASVTGGIMQAPMGLLADRFGSKRILVGGFAFTLLGFFLLSTGQSLPMLVLAQIVVGIGNSTFHPASFPAVAEATKHTGLGMGMALHNIGGTVGAAIAYSLVALLATWLGWRYALRYMVGVGALLAVYFAVVYVEPARLVTRAALARRDGEAANHSDTDGETTSGESEGTAGRNESLQGTGGSGGPGQSRLAQWTPVLVITVAGFLSGCFGSSLMTFLPTFFADTRGATAIVAGILATLMQGSGAVGSFFGGKLADRHERSSLVLYGAGITAVLVFILANTSLPAIALAVVLMLIGASRSMTRPPFHAITSDVAPEGMSGSVFGLIFGGSFLGGSVGNPLVGYIADHASLQLAFVVIAGLYLAHGLLIRYLGWRDMTGEQEADTGLAVS